MATSSVLVTGSSGTIGTALCERLLNDGHEVVGVDSRRNQWSEAVEDHTVCADLRDESAVEALPDAVDVVIHLAANARVQPLIDDPALAMENFDTTFTTLEYARSVGANVVFASSREVYGDGDAVVYGESDTSVGDAHNPYAASKVGGEALVRSYEQCYGVDATILRFSNVYGRYDISNRVVPLFVAKAVREEPLTIYGDDKVLDFVYIEDAVDALIRVIEASGKAKGSTFNVGSERGSSLVELATHVVDATDADVSVDIESNRTGEVSRFVADGDAARRVLGYEPAFDLQAGVKETVNWYRSRPELFDEILN